MSDHKDDNTNPILAKWLDGSITQDELESLKAEYSIEHLNMLKAATDQLETADFDENKFLGSVNAEVHGKTRTISETDTRPNSRAFLRIAASILLLIGVGLAVLFMTSRNETTYRTVAGEKKDFNLPDGSKVTLFGNSSVTFTEDNWDKERNISMAGNVFYNVKSGNTFQVEFDAGTVQVLGTEFEVFESNNFFKVKCFEGKVLTTAQKSKDTITLTEGSGVQLSQNGMLEEIEIESIKPDWDEKYSRYNKVPLSAVIIALENQFGININAEEIDQNTIVNVKFINNDLEKALFMTFAPYSIEFTIDDRSVTLNYK